MPIPPYSIDVNGNDNTPEWGYCTVAGCEEAAFPIWLSGEEPDDPDLYLCPKHIGARILHEQTARNAYQELATRAEAITGDLLVDLAAERAENAILKKALDAIDRHAVGAYTTEEGAGANVEPCEWCGEMREIAAQALAAQKAREP